MKPYHQFTADPDDEPEHNPSHVDAVMEGTGWGRSGARATGVDRFTVGGVDLTAHVIDYRFDVEPATKWTPVVTPLYDPGEPLT